MAGKRRKVKRLVCLEALENIEDEETMETLQYKNDDQGDVTESDNGGDVIDEINETGVGTISNKETGRNENVDMLQDFNEAKDGELKIDEWEETQKRRMKAVVKNSGNQATRSMASRDGARKRKNNIKDGGIGGKRPKKSAEKEYEVEEIIGHKKVRGVSHFLMRWKGFTKDDDTWEPEYALNCPVILERYKKKNRLNLPKLSKDN